MLVGEEIVKMWRALGTLQATFDTLQALSSSRVLKLLNANPALRLIFLSEIEYAELSHWVGFLKSVHPQVKIVLYADKHIASNVAADAHLPPAPTKRKVLQVVNSLLTA
jgi:hypothetical protein